MSEPYQRLTRHAFSSSDSCVACLSASMATTLKDALRHRRRASIALSGGRSPKAVLTRLASSDVDWSRIDVTLTDDRWVPPDDDASNEKLANESFLKAGAGAANFFGLRSEGHTLRTGVIAASRRLAGCSFPLDVVYLGVGPDGHVASLFPSAAWARFLGRGRCVLGRSPVEPKDRISLDLETLLTARTIFLHVAGFTKRQLIKRVMRSASMHPRLPVSLVLGSGHSDIRIFEAP